MIVGLEGNDNPVWSVLNRKYSQCALNAYNFIASEVYDVHFTGNVNKKGKELQIRITENTC